MHNDKYIKKILEVGVKKSDLFCHSFASFTYTVIQNCFHDAETNRFSIALYT